VTKNFEESARALGYSVVGTPQFGAVSTTVEARHIASGDAVKLKLLAPGHDVARLKREAAILSTIHHPGVERFREHRAAGGWQMLVVDYSDGETLAEFVDRRGALSFDDSMHLVEQLAAALDTVHSAGIVHPELEPDNILALAGSGPRPSLKITDFGLVCTKPVRNGVATNGTADANGAAAAAALRPVDRAALRRSRYRAPEVILGEPATPQTDQYSIAVLLYKLLTGVWPFPTTDALAEVEYHHVHTEPTLVRKFKPSLIGSVEDALMRALAKDPASRFPTMSEFVAAVRGDADRRRVLAGAQPPEGKAKDKLATGRLREVLKAVVAIAIGIGIGAVGYLAFLAPTDDGGTRDVSTPTTQPDSVADQVAGTVVEENLAQALEIEAWESGFAATLADNLVAESGFEGAVIPDNFYLDPNNPDRERIVSGRGVDASNGLEIGDPGVFGSYGEVVAADPDTSYFFSFHVQITGDVGVAQAWVDWLDADMEVIGSSNVLNLLGLPDGQQALLTEPAPANAVFGVPRVVKGEGPGVLFVDELVFASTESAEVADLLG